MVPPRGHVRCAHVGFPLTPLWVYYELRLARAALALIFRAVSTHAGSEHRELREFEQDLDDNATKYTSHAVGVAENTFPASAVRENLSRERGEVGGRSY